MFSAFALFFYQRSLSCLSPLQNECRYAVYDFDYKLPDGSQRDKILFVVWYVQDSFCFFRSSPPSY